MSRKTLVQILKQQAEAHRRTHEGATHTTSLIEGLQQDAPGFQDSDFTTLEASQGYFDDHI